MQLLQEAHEENEKLKGFMLQFLTSTDKVDLQKRSRVNRRCKSAPNVRMDEWSPLSC